MWKQMEERGKTFLEVVPLKEPREDSFSILSSDSDIKDFDYSKFIFTDITFDATNRVIFYENCFFCLDHLFFK